MAQSAPSSFLRSRMMSFWVLLECFPVPLGIGADDWSALAKGQAVDPSVVQARGVGLVWDLSGVDGEPVSQVGVVVTSAGAKADSEFSSIMNQNNGGIASCQSGGILLWASTPKLLTRMRESCDGQNRNLSQSLEGASLGSINLKTSSLLVSLHLAEVTRQLVRVGLSRASSEAHSRLPEASRASYSAAQQAVSQRAESVVGVLPSVLYAGGVQGEGVVLQGVVR